MDNIMISCTRKLTFCAGHRVLGHESKCATPHGHNYEVHITATAPKLDEIGRIIDFSILKEKIGEWIDKKWDHTFILYQEDKDLIQALSSIKGKKPPFIASFNPTAENIAHYLLSVVCKEVLEGTGITVTKITLYETINCYAEAALQELKGC